MFPQTTPSSGLYLVFGIQYVTSAAPMCASDRGLVFGSLLSAFGQPCGVGARGINPTLQKRKWEEAPAIFSEAAFPPELPPAECDGAASLDGPEEFLREAHARRSRLARTRVCPVERRGLGAPRANCELQLRGPACGGEVMTAAVTERSYVTFVSSSPCCGLFWNTCLSADWQQPYFTPAPGNTWCRHVIVSVWCPQTSLWIVTPIPLSAATSGNRPCHKLNNISRLLRYSPFCSLSNFLVRLNKFGL